MAINMSCPHLVTFPANTNASLLFLHIPKTAGTTFSNILESRFDADKVCPVHTWDDILRYPNEQLQKFALFTGHFGYSVQSLVSKPLLLVTMLRDPVRRAISQYLQLRRSKPAYWPTSNNSLREYVADSNINGAIVNAQTLFLGNNCSVHEVLTLVASKECINAWKYFGKLPVGNKELAIAKQRISESAFVGISEQFDASVDLLCYTFGWPAQGRSQILNKSNDYEVQEVSQEVIEAIKELNVLDEELYEHAKQVFKERYAAMMSQVLDLHYVQQSDLSMTPADKCVIDFSKALPGTGWQAREKDHPNMRWTGPGTIATLDVKLKRCDLMRLRFRIVTVLADDILESLVVKVNGRPVELASESAAPLPGLWLNATVNINALSSDVPRQGSLTRISFHVDRTVRPCDVLTGNQDCRHVGVAIADICIKACK